MLTLSPVARYPLCSPLTGCPLAVVLPLLISHSVVTVAVSFLFQSVVLFEDVCATFMCLFVCDIWGRQGYRSKHVSDYGGIGEISGLPCDLMHNEYSLF